MLERIRKWNEVIYKCSDCGIILAELMDSGEVIIRNDCRHYRWTEVSSSCYYYKIPGCGRSAIKWLQENYILKLETPGTVHLLLPNQS